MIKAQEAWLQETGQQRLKQQPTGNVAASYAAILMQFLQQQGFATQALLTEVGIAEALLKQADANISAGQYAKLVHGALALSAEPALGLYYGQRLNISTHGLLGFAVMSSPSLEKAAELAMKYIQIRNQLVSIGFDDGDGSEMAISFSVDLHVEALYRFEVETSISSLYSICKELFGGSGGVKTIHFSFPEPEDLSAYQSVFSDLPIEFSQPCNKLFIKPEVFDVIGRTNSPALMQIAEQQCQSLLNHTSGLASQSLAEKVEQLLLSSPANFISQESIAEKLGMSSRTLVRRLAKENKSFIDIRDSIRQSLAKQALLETTWAIEDIATILGYSDSANFNRAFKRWFVLTPKQYRDAKNSQT